MDTLTDYIEYINRLPGVISADISADENAISEIHVLSNGTRTPKQIVRDVQSILFARFHQKIDYKIVSVAQINMPTAENLVAKAENAAAEADKKDDGSFDASTCLCAPDPDNMQAVVTDLVESKTVCGEVFDDNPRLVINEISVSKRPTEAEVSVSLSLAGKQYSCSQTCSNEKIEYYRAISQATLDAVCAAFDYAFGFSVLDVRLIDIACEPVVITCVSMMSGGCLSVHYCGSAFVSEDIDIAVVKAALDAVNRIIMRKKQ